MSALPIVAPLDIKAASSANSIAVGFTKNPDDSFAFVGPLIADIEKVFVPQVGLSDGLVHQLYENYIKTEL